MAGRKPSGQGPPKRKPLTTQESAGADDDDDDETSSEEEEHQPTPKRPPRPPLREGFESAAQQYTYDYYHENVKRRLTQMHGVGSGADPNASIHTSPEGILQLLRSPDINRPRDVRLMRTWLYVHDSDRPLTPPNLADYEEDSDDDSDVDG
jgi:hypothetical protein